MRGLIGGIHGLGICARRLYSRNPLSSSEPVSSVAYSSFSLYSCLITSEVMSPTR